MGFNPRLAPYTVSKTIEVRATSKDAATSQQFTLYRFPFAGQLVGAYANIRRVTLAGSAADAAIEATTNTGVKELSIWRVDATDTTATYTDALWAASRHAENTAGAITEDSSTGGGINWHLPTTARTTAEIAAGNTNGIYAMENSSASLRKFGAGDLAMMHIDPYGATDAHRAWNVEIQMDYIIGHES